MVASASAGISGVCSVAGRVGVERLLEVLPWSCGLFPIEPIARNAARKDVDKPKELTSTNHAHKRMQRFGWDCSCPPGVFRLRYPGLGTLTTSNSGI